MPSELWQRLKAARSHAGLRQLDVSKPLGIHRTAVTLWESKNESQRTKPDLDQIKTLSALYRVPLEWLLSDASEIDDLERVSKNFKPSSPAIDPARALEAFTRAVEFEILTKRPDMADGFHARVGVLGRQEVKPDFCFRDLLVCFSTPKPAGLDMDALAKLLLLERAKGTPAHKLLVVWTNKDEPGAIAAATSAGAASELFGIEVMPVKSPADAASRLISLSS